jgi:hypothetical protein
MFHLESRIQDWRNTMQAAGVTDPSVLRELESHLRDDFTRILHSSSAAEPAFAEAVANLGQPGEIKQEFDRAVIAPRGRIQRLLFPTNLRYYAMVALVIAPFLIFPGIGRISGTWIFHPEAHRIWGWSEMYFWRPMFLMPAIGVLGLIAAILYLRKPGQVSALHLAGFHCFFGWWWAYGLLRSILVLGLGMPFGRFRLWGLSYDPFSIPPFSLTAIILGGVGFYFWRRAILGVGSSSSQAGSRRLGAS